MQKGNLKAHIDARQFVVLIYFSFRLLMSLLASMVLNTIARIVMMLLAMPQRGSDTERVSTDTNHTTLKNTSPDCRTRGRKESTGDLVRRSQATLVVSEPPVPHRIVCHNLHRRTLDHPNLLKLPAMMIFGWRSSRWRAITPQIQS